MQGTPLSEQEVNCIYKACDRVSDFAYYLSGLIGVSRFLFLFFI